MKSPISASALKRIFLSAVAASSMFTASYSFGQVNGAGPSDPGLFTNVFNIPTDPDIGESQIFGGVAGETTQINLSEGGTIGSNAEFNSGVELNMDGGTMRFSNDANAGSEVNISGGTVVGIFNISGSEADISGGLFNGSVRFGGGVDQPAPNTLSLRGGIFAAELFLSDSNFRGPSIAEITGGSFRSRFQVSNVASVPNGDFSLLGGDFKVNGTPINDSNLVLADGDIFSGTFQNGSSFIFADQTGDRIRGLTLRTVALPTAAIDPIVVNTPQPDSSIRSGETLILQDGGDLNFFRSVDASLIIEGGNFSRGEVSGSTVNVSGGNAGFFGSPAGITSFFSEVNISGGSAKVIAYSSEINVSGGTATVEARSNNVVNVTGGTAANVSASQDSVINISGGSLDSVSASGNLNISGGIFNQSPNVGTVGETNISGGTFTNGFRSDSNDDVRISGGNFASLSGPDIELVGGEFKLNGNDFSGSIINLSDEDVFTGTLQDGSSFIFSTLAGGNPSDLVLSSVEPLPNINATPIVIDTTQNLPGLREGETLTLQDGGDLNVFRSVGGTFNLEGGNLGQGAIVANSVVNISGGTVGNGFKALFGSEINISGGTVGDSETDGRFTTVYDSTVNITGGDIARGFRSERSTINISGGTFLEEEGGGVSLLFSDRSIASISGGDLDRVSIDSGSEVNFAGGNATSFFLRDDGQLNVSGGTTGITAIDNSIVDISGGNITFLSATDSSTVNVSGGDVESASRADSGSTVNISGGSVGNDFEVSYGSTVNISGGSIGNNFLASRNGFVNISGGSVGDGFEANTGSVVEISGGVIGSGFIAQSGAEVIIADGQFGDQFSANTGSTVNISGGQFGQDFTADSRSNVSIGGGSFGSGVRITGTTIELRGGEFRRDGFDISVLPSISIVGNSVLTGTLADGSTFIFSNSAGDFISNVTLTNVDLPAADATPIVVNTPSSDQPIGLRSGQTLTLVNGGGLGNNFQAVNAVVNIEGGVIGDGLGAAGSTVNISGGTVGDGFVSFAGSIVNINDGIIGDDFNAAVGSEVFVSGGQIGQGFEADGLLRINGGTIGRGFEAAAGSDVQLSGGEFQLNGQAFNESAISLAAGDLFTGVLEDGTAFIFTTETGDILNNVLLNQTAVPEADLTPLVVSPSSPDAPASLRFGQTLTLEQNAIISGEFEAIGGVVNIDGGIFTDDTAFSDTIVNLDGGVLGGNVVAFEGSELNLFSGTIDELVAGSGAQINLHGGTFESSLRVNAGSVIDVFATEFFIDGIEVEFADFDTPQVIPDLNFRLSGTFADGSTFQYLVRSSFNDGDLIVSNDASLRLNLVEAILEPTLLGDVNLDGIVNFLDIAPFVSVLTATGFQAEADIDQSGEVNFLDISPFVEILVGSQNDQ